MTCQKNRPYDNKNNKYKNRMNKLLIDSIKARDANNHWWKDTSKFLILDGTDMRTSKTLIKNKCLKKAQILCIEKNKEVCEKHNKVHKIKSLNMDLDDFIASNETKNKKYQCMIYDTTGTIDTCGNLILNSIENNMMKNGTIFLVTFSKRSYINGDNFNEQLLKWKKKLVSTLSTKKLFLTNVPGITNPVLPYAGKIQSAMYSEFFMVTTNSMEEINIIPNENNLYEVSKIINHFGDISKKE